MNCLRQAAQFVKTLATGALAGGLWRQRIDLREAAMRADRAFRPPLAVQAMMRWPDMEQMRILWSLQMTVFAFSSLIFVAGILLLTSYYGAGATIGAALSLVVMFLLLNTEYRRRTRDKK